MQSYRTPPSPDAVVDAEASIRDAAGEVAGLRQILARAVARTSEPAFRDADRFACREKRIQVIRDRTSFVDVEGATETWIHDDASTDAGDRGYPRLGASGATDRAVEAESPRRSALAVVEVGFAM